MTRDDIIRMAEQASCGWIKNGTQPALFGEKQLELFAALVAAAEREACAKVCEAEAEKWEGDDGPICYEARMCVVNIRARGQA